MRRPSAAILAPFTYTPGAATRRSRLDPASGKQVYHGLFHDPHERPHGERPAPHVEQQIDDELARAVIGDLSAAVRLDHRNAAVDSRQMLAARPRRPAYRPADAR